MTKVVNSVLLLCFLFILTCAFFSCEKERRVVLNESEKVIYDSLYRKKAADAKILGDSLCSSTRDSVFNRLVDSILTVTQRNVNQLLEK